MINIIITTIRFSTKGVGTFSGFRSGPNGDSGVVFGVCDTVGGFVIGLSVDVVVVLVVVLVVEVVDDVVGALHGVLVVVVVVVLVVVFVAVVVLLFVAISKVVNIYFLLTMLAGS